MKRIYADSHPPLLNPRDIDFLLYEWLDAGALCDRPRYSEHSIESFDSVLDLAADIAIKRFAPHFKTADTQEPGCASAPASKTRRAQEAHSSQLA